MAEGIVLANDLLKGVMADAMVYRGLFYNIDECKSPGIYGGSADQVSGTLPNFPGTGDWRYGSLEVINGRPPRIHQRLCSENGDVAVRVLNGTWLPWKLMTS